jgi:OOP family OmpA-OmpF porin
MNPKHLLLPILLLPFGLYAQQNVATDGEWAAQRVSLQNTPEAGFMYRVGDVDNLGFGWEEGFNPFCGRTTEPHAYPWEALEADLPGLDRILMSSHFDPNKEQPCAGDGYSGTFDPAKSKPQPIEIEVPELKGQAIQDAFLLLFIDDFQSPSFCSRYQVSINGNRFVDAERVINAIEQGGPVGKLLTIALPEEFFPALQSGRLSVLIDELNGAADGFAIDFVKLLVNRKRDDNCIGSIDGFVYDLETHEPIVDATVRSSKGVSLKSEVTGYFQIKNVPTGMEVVSATAPGYKEGFGTADIGIGDENEPITIYLQRDAQTADFDGQKLSAGQVITLDKLLFDQGSAKLRSESKAELDKLAAFLEAHPDAEIELSGYTSAEGDAALNRSLSYQRVRACKDYITAKGLDTGRITTVGFGPEHPVAPNDTEENRAKNRRVELRVLKL